jgi:hypothetical protein
MSGSKKIAIWMVMTASHRITVDVFEDEEQGLFIAKPAAGTATHVETRRLPTQTPGRVPHDELQPIQHHDLEVLKGQVRVTLAARYGEILRFYEQEV